MFRALSRSYFQPVSVPVVTTKTGGPVCPECHSSLNRVQRRFIDRVLSLVYPVHRYHCRSYLCNWEGNLRYTAELGRWEASDRWSDGAPASGYRSDVVTPSAAATEPSSVAPSPRAAPTAATTGATHQRESDTLPMPPPRTPKSKKPDARAESRDGTNAPRRARKRAKADPR